MGKEIKKAVLSPDVDKLKTMIKQAKGASRTMAQYAKQCGVSAATLSRIANGKILDNISEELIRKLYEFQDSDVNFSLEDWRRANGMLELGYFRMPSDKNRRAKGTKMMQSIIYALVNRLSVKKTDSCEGGLNARMSKPSLRLHLPEKDRYWSFYIYPDVLDELPDVSMGDESSLNRMFIPVTPIFLTDVWQPCLLEKEKISFVFMDERLMKLLIKFLSGAEVKNEFSIILIDKDGETILKETDLKGEELPESAFGGVSEETTLYGMSGKEDIE